MREFEYVIKDEIGIHARPAGLLVKEAKNYQSQIIIKKENKQAEATKLLAVMGLAVKCGEKVAVEITGTDEEVAAEAMQHFFENNM